MNDTEEEYQSLKVKVMQSIKTSMEKVVRYPIVVDYSFFNETLRKYFNNDRHVYAKYFITKENESKSNLLILQNEITRRRYIIAFTTFLLYNGVKSVLWNRGYFANFFFHTRMMSVVILGMTLILIKRDSEVYQIKENLYRYSLKHNQYNRIKREVELDRIRREAINNKLSNDITREVKV